MTHRLNLVLLLLALAIGAPYWWLLVDNPSRQVPPHPLHIAELRTLADSLPGQHPTGIGRRVIGWDRTPGTLLSAGSGVRRSLYAVLSFRLEVPGRGPIIIDTGTTGALAASRHIGGFNGRAQARVDADMRRASLIIPTDETPETLGGLAALSGRDRAAYALTLARLNPAQVPGASRGLPWPPRFTVGAAITGTRPIAVAPGVVVIPAGAPTPGVQMVYVKLASGREYLFAGAVAPYDSNLAALRAPSRFSALLAGGQDRAGTMRWLVTLKRLRDEASGLLVVPGHEIMGQFYNDVPTGIPELD